MRTAKTASNLFPCAAISDFAIFFFFLAQYSKKFGGNSSKLVNDREMIDQARKKKRFLEKLTNSFCIL